MIPQSYSQLKKQAEKLELWRHLVFICLATTGTASAQSADEQADPNTVEPEPKSPVVRLFDGGWLESNGTKQFVCETENDSFELNVIVSDDASDSSEKQPPTVNLIVNGETKPPLHITYGQNSIVYIFGAVDDGTGILVDFTDEKKIIKQDFGKRLEGRPSSFSTLRCL